MPLSQRCDFEKFQLYVTTVVYTKLGSTCLSTSLDIGNLNNYKLIFQFDVVPLIIQLTDQFFKRMMAFFFPGKNSGDDDEDLENLNKDTRNASLLGLSAGSASDPIAIKPKPPSPSKQKSSLTSSSQSLAKSVDKETPTSSRKNW